MGQWAQWLRGEKGQGLVEYAFILTLVALVAVVALTLLGVDLGEIFDDIAGIIRRGGRPGIGQGIGGGRLQ